MRLAGYILLLLSLSSCNNQSQDENKNSGVKVKTERVLSEKKDSTSSGLNRISIIEQSLTSAYPSTIAKIRNNHVFLINGDSILFDDGRKKSHLELLEETDIEDMFIQPYKVPEDKPAYLYDPGRSRAEILFKAMYGESAKKVEQNLTTLEWFGQKVKFNSINGAADSLKAVAKELSQWPDLKHYLKSSGTFYWRPVRGANRMSAHSYGIAFDIGVDKSNYWQWTLGSNDEMKEVKYQNKIPREIVEIFQKHGFIWGGAWYHYDTMHFEFRPDLLLYVELVKADGQ